jgi:hypothetical protein
LAFADPTATAAGVGAGNGFDAIYNAVGLGNGLGGGLGSTADLGGGIISADPTAGIPLPPSPPTGIPGDPGLGGGTIGPSMDVASLGNFPPGGAAAAVGTPTGFAPTDAELYGGITGTGGGDPSLLSRIGSSITGNPLQAAGLALGAGNIVKNTIAPPQLPNQGELKSIANEAGTFSAQNASMAQKFLQPSLTGVLPPQLEAQVQLAMQDAQSTMASKYASLGLGNSTMAAQAQANIQLETEAMRGQLAQQLAATGTSLMSAATTDLNIEASIYNDLMNAQVHQDTALETSISGFANAVAYASIAGTKNAAPTAAATHG